MKSDSVFLHNEECPKCASFGRDRSKNNLGVYSDGHKHCWSCGYYESATASEYLRSGLSNERDTSGELGGRSWHLPVDIGSYIPSVARLWLSLSGITEYEIVNNKLLWSESKQQLIFPYFDKYNNLVAYQARNFKDGHKSKWVSYGKMDKLYHILPIKEVYERIVLVEDVVSAIVVSRHTSCMPLFGSQISVERFVRLSKLCTGLSIWLDWDKRSEAVRFSRRSLVSCDVIITEKDPKEYTNEEIRNILHEHL